MKRRKEEQEEEIRPKIRIKDLRKRPYGLLAQQGISPYGMSPREAWETWNQFRRENKKNKPKRKDKVRNPVLKRHEAIQPVLTPKEPVKAIPATVKNVLQKEVKPAFTSTKYAINEESARRAWESFSMSDYRAGSTTEGYNADVERFDENVNALIKRYKNNDTLTKKDWERVYAIAERYSKNRAEYENTYNARHASGPASWVLTGPANYPVRQHEKKMRALQRIYDDNKDKVDPNNNIYLKEIQGILSNRAIKSSDENAVAKLKKKLADLEAAQVTDKAMNAYFRKNGTIVGFEGVDEKTAKEWQAKHDSGDYFHRKPVMPYVFQNRNAEIHRVKERIETLEKEKTSGVRVHEYGAGSGLQVVENAELMRIQLKFDGKPSAETITKLKSNGFRWSPSQGAWQRNLNSNGRYAAKRVIDELK